MDTLDLFSGIGGFALACHRLGITTTQFVEKEPFCQQILAQHFPHVPIHDDITTFIPTRRYDLITAGFPCQDLSSANPNGRGLEGERSGLFFEVVRLIRTIQPRFVLLENVPNLLNRGLDRVLWELAQSGFDAEWQIVSAASMGAPHQRERIFIIAYPKSLRWDGLGNPSNIGTANSQINPFSHDCKTTPNPMQSRREEFNPATVPTESGFSSGGCDVFTPNPQGNGRRSGQSGDDYQVQQQDGAEGFEVGGGESATRPQPNQGPIKPGICGVDDGLPYWLDKSHPDPISHGSPYRNQRLKALGNSVVPQAVEVPLKRILEIANG